MHTKEAFQTAMNMSDMVLTTYVSDLSDAELMLRPGPGCNHLAWQLGHLIAAEVSMVNDACPGKGSTLPAGFAEVHAKENSGCDDASQFKTKQEYLDLYKKVRASTMAAINDFSDADLDGPTPERMRGFFPKVGQYFMLIATHPLMHAGQFVVVRRKLGKPILI